MLKTALITEVMNVVTPKPPIRVSFDGRLEVSEIVLSPSKALPFDPSEFRAHLETTLAKLPDDLRDEHRATIVGVIEEFFDPFNNIEKHRTNCIAAVISLLMDEM